MSKNNWPDLAKQLATELHAELSLNNKNWHQLKSVSDRRAAELIAASLVQLIGGGETSDVQALLDQGMLWLKGEIKDPGCPHR